MTESMDISSHYIRIECKNGNIPLSQDEFTLISQFSKLIINMIDDIGEENIEAIPLECTTEVFSHILQYCKIHENDMETEDNKEAIRLSFIKNGIVENAIDSKFAETITGTFENPNIDLLVSIFLISNYLDIEGLCALMSMLLARFIKQIAKNTEKSEIPEAIRQFFSLPQN